MYNFIAVYKFDVYVRLKHCAFGMEMDFLIVSLPAMRIIHGISYLFVVYYFYFSNEFKLNSRRRSRVAYHQVHDFFVPSILIFKNDLVCAEIMTQNARL